MTWLLAAAEMGFAIAHAELGQRYAEGRFVARSLPRAYFWYTVGASQAHPAAIAGQRTLAGQLTEAERQAADDEAAAWLARWAKAHPNGPVVKRLYGPVAR
jgi:TPR repeat protein